MKPILKIKRPNNTKSFSIGSIFKKKENDVISKFMKSRKETLSTNDNQNNLNNNNILTESNSNNHKKTMTIMTLGNENRKSELLFENENYINSNSIFNKNTTNSKKFNRKSRVATNRYPLAFVELTDTENRKLFLTESIKGKNKNSYSSIKHKNRSIIKKSEILYNFYTNFMKKKHQKELLQSHLFKQKFYDQFLKYSPNFLKRIVLINEDKEEKIKLQNEKYLNSIKTENNLKVYNDFKNKIKRRLIEGNISYESENTNEFINGIQKYLYKNIMSYDNLITLLTKLKGKMTLHLAKMISEFLSDKFYCFMNIKKSKEAQFRLNEICELLKIEKYAEGDMIYNIDNYENKYMLLLKGTVNAYERYFVMKTMKISEFINYLKIIKDKENNLIKLYRIIEKNIFEEAFNSFDIIEKNFFEISLISHYLDISEEVNVYVEEIRRVHDIIQGENINKYANELHLNQTFNLSSKNNKKGIIFSKSSLSEIREFLEKEKGKQYFRENYSDKKYICAEDCYFISIDKEAFEKKLKDLKLRFTGENNEMFLLRSFIFKNFEKEDINLILKNNFNKKYLMNGEYLYKQNEISDKIYIIVRGDFTQTISLNSKRIEEVKKYISFEPTKNIFTLWDDRIKKTITKEEVENFFSYSKKLHGDFPFENSEKNKNKEKKKKDIKEININKINLQQIMQKKREIIGVNDFQNSKLKNYSKYDVLGMEEAIEGKNRFTNVKCESIKGEVYEIKISDFISFCFRKSINIDYLKGILSNIKNILIQKIEKLVLVKQNSLTNISNDFQEDNEEDKNINKTKKIKIYKKNNIDDNIPFDPVEVALNSLNQYKKNKIKEKKDLNYSNIHHSLNSRIRKKIDFYDLFFGYFTEKTVNIDDELEKDDFMEKLKTKKIVINNDAIKNCLENDINNNNIYEEMKFNNENEIESKNENNDNISKKDHPKNNNILNNNIFELKTKSARNLKKKMFIENLRFNNFSHSLHKHQNKQESESEEIRRKYIIAKKKLEKSYLNREKLYYMKNFKNFPFIKYIYGKKKKKINYEESLFTRLNKDLAKQQKIKKFLKKLNCGGSNILFSNEVKREAGYYSKNNSRNKISTRNSKEKNFIYSNSKTQYGNDFYDLGFCFLKHIDFSNNK